MTEGAYLGVYLTPLAPYLAQPDVTDLYINRPGEIWIERLEQKPERHAAPALTESLLWRLAKQVASLTHQGISREHPLLSARLPDGARIQIIAPPATRGPIAIAIRKHLVADMTLDDYVAQGAFAQTVRGDRANDDDQLASLYEAGDWSAFLRLAVRQRKIILISGGTSTGKTTFLNALLQEVDASERLVLIEDTPEIKLRHDNAIGLVAVRGELGETSVTPDDLLTATLRMRPDRIIVGELRGPEAATFLRAANTGHPGSMSTIHADTPEGAIEQLAMLASPQRPDNDRHSIKGYARGIIDIVVQLARTEARRGVSHVVWHGGGPP
ncbi:P-type DNA transfer ATPase VirB11 [Sphingomonas sanguinis]|uniref:Type IV secretion system protein n=1 Tax=Sphingomonas sanguinis TaxID=33051 RepID=A0A147J5V7_9SPHN|nr:P-type DNA transfer ATPase VirB11 [Sphingomonas sanguinis]KTW09904.1 type VI secretion protein [Sphingomonas sanguinis]